MLMCLFFFNDTATTEIYTLSPTRRSSDLSSRGFDPPGCPGEPLVSYQINRQLPGWNLPPLATRAVWAHRSEEHTSELQSRQYLVCRLLLEKKKTSNAVLHTRITTRNKKT